MTTLYDTLGVSEHANADELKRAYRKAMMKWHPDRNAGNEAAARAAFQDVKAAYAILSDPSQRREYDTIFAAEMRRWAKDHTTSTHTDAERETQARARDREAAQAAAREEAQRESQREAQREAERESQRKAQQAREREAERDAQREAQRHAEAQGRYGEHVAHAMRYAAEGYNRDVVFGVLLGRQCDPLDARRIADSVAAWHASPAPVEPSASSAGSAASASSTSPVDDDVQAGSNEKPDVVATDAAAADHEDVRATPRRPNGKRKKPHAPTTDHPSHGTSDAPRDDAHAASPAHAFSTLWYHFLNGLKL
jgi:Skp family chaperone for outer membrane proteins